MTGWHEKPAPAGVVQYINPEGMLKNKDFTQVVVVTGQVKTIYVSGQGAMDASGNIVGKGDITMQAEYVLNSLRTALAAVGAGLEHIVKLNVYLAQGQPLQPAIDGFRSVAGDGQTLATTTVMYVVELVPPDYLVVVDAVAVVPQAI